MRLPSSVLRFAAAFACFAVLACFSRVARAETFEAPIGGKPVTLGEGRVACVATAGGWRVEPGGRSVRPPTTAAAVGVSGDLRVAPSATDCARATASVRLVATAPWPTFDASAIVLAVDEGRLEARGRGLQGVLLTWPLDTGRASEACHDLKAEAGVETCTWGVPKTLPGDPGASPLRWLPAGAQLGPDTEIYDAEGKLAAPEGFAITPSRVEVTEILPSDASLDVSSGVGRAPLTHPETIAAVDCGTSRCSADSGQLVMQAPPATVSTVDVKFRFVPHVFYARKNPPDPQPVLRVSILRCPMTVVSGLALRGVDTARAVVRVEGGCMRDVTALRFLVGGRQADVMQTENAKDAAYAVINLGAIDAPTVSITAVRGEGEGTVVAVARTETRSAPVIRTVLEIPGFAPIDFIPNNRPAIVRFPQVKGAELALLSIDDVYDAKQEGAETTVQGDINAVGLVALSFGYRVPSLPAPLDKINLGVLQDTLQRSVKEANVPAPFGLSASTSTPLVEVVCSESAEKDVRAVPGVTLHLPYRAREGCRVIIHRERLSPEYGTQRVSLEIDVNKLDGSTRPEGHVTQPLTLRAGPEPRIAWIKGIAAPYDRVIIRLSPVADEAHYLGAADIVSGAPAVQWSILFGTGHVRLYATTAIPTGLYRFGNSEGSGILSLSLAVVARLTWLDTDGHEGLLGLETGIMAFGFTNSSGQALTEVGAIAGVGLSIPIAGAGAPTQASINLHAWFEQRLTNPTTPANEMGTTPGGAPITIPQSPASARAIIVGPSISFGNIGSTF
jgi:hypothetical protein